MRIGPGNTLSSTSTAARPHHHLQAPPGPITPSSEHHPDAYCPRGLSPHRRAWQPGPINVARNSLATTSNFEVTLLELQRFQRLLKLHQNELRAKFWETVPQPTQQVARRHERPRPRARCPRGPPHRRAWQPGHTITYKHRQDPQPYLRSTIRIGCAHADRLCTSG